MVPKRLSTGDVEAMRRSLAMTPSLAPAQLRWLLDEADRLLALQAEVEAVVLRLRRPFGDVRCTLNDLAAARVARARV